MTTFMSLNCKAAGQILAEARPAEHRLDQHGPVEQAAEGQRDDGEQLDADVLEGMLQMTCRRLAPLARAAMTYSWLSCSSMKLRVMRLM